MSFHVIDEEVIEYVRSRATYRPQFPGMRTRWQDTVEVKITRSVHRDRIMTLTRCFGALRGERFPLAAATLARAAIHVMLQLHWEFGDGVGGVSIMLLEILGSPKSAAPPANRSGDWAEIHALFLALLQAADDGICDCLDPMGEAGVCGEHYQGQGDQLQGQFDRLCAAAGRLLGDSVR